MLFDEWLSTVGEGVAGYVTPEGRGRGGRRQRAGRDPAHPARRLRLVAVPGRLGRRRLLAVGDRDEGSARGDGHRVRAGLADRGARRTAPRLRARPDVLDRVPLPHDRRRAARAIRSRRARSGSSRRDAMPQPLAGAHRWLDLAFRAIDGESSRHVVRPAPRPDLARRVPTRQLLGRAARAAARRSRPCRSRVPTRRRSPRGRRGRCDRARARARAVASSARRAGSISSPYAGKHSSPSHRPVSGRTSVAEPQRVRIDALR